MDKVNSVDERKGTEAQKEKSKPLGMWTVMTTVVTQSHTQPNNIFYLEINALIRPWAHHRLMSPSLRTLYGGDPERQISLLNTIGQSLLY